MTSARKHLVCLDETPYYHVSSRCVRRAYLCGHDQYTGESYEHRRSWIEQRLRVLSSLFSIDICAYAILSNHYHLVVRIDSDRPQQWSDHEVLIRWTALFKGPILVQRYCREEPLSDVELDSLHSMAAVYRSRLGNLSWFMKCLNEPIARKANAEDCCTGHFWEARFHSKALKSSRAVVAAMVYVDLNPVRAANARTPEDSDYTSIRARIRRRETSAALRKAIRALTTAGELQRFDVELRPLMPFTDRSLSDRAGTTFDRTLPISESDYLALVDETGRIASDGKRGRIDPDFAPILDRIGCPQEYWVELSMKFRGHTAKRDALIINTD